MSSTSHASVHVDLHYLAFLQWVNDARVMILLTVPSYRSQHFRLHLSNSCTNSKITNSKIANPRTIMFHCCSHEPNPRLQGDHGCSIPFFLLNTTTFHSLSGLTNGMIYISWEDVHSDDAS